MDSTSIIIIFVFVVVAGIALGVRFARQPNTVRSAERGAVKPNLTSLTSLIRHQKPDAQPFLLATGGTFDRKRINLSSVQITIGRGTDNAIVIDDDLVSRQHALIELRHDGYVLHDRGSTNGTYVNGQQIYQHLLHPGDQIQVGPTALVLTVPGKTANNLPSPQVVAPVQLSRPTAYDLGQYDLIKTLGEGGAARVYYGMSKRDHRPVAIKILSSNDPYFLDKFKMELEIGKTLRHPYITSIYGGSQNKQGTWYIVMELNEGGSLRDRMPLGQALQVTEAIRVVGQTCDALLYAHRRGIYHRDLKPENLMFAANNEVKLSDFGIARIASRKTVTSRGVLVGTAEYMSVEQARGHDLDGRSDLYSLGIVLYEMLTGRRPFEGAEPLGILEQHIRAMPQPPSAINPALPPWIDNAVLRALEKDPNHRYQTAEEFARALGYDQPFHTGDEQATVISAAVAAKARLVVSTTHQVIPLDTTKELILGREWTNPNPNDDLISRQHARIVWRGGYWIEDLSSANGTSVNGARIWQGQPVLLQPNSIILLGNTQLQFEA